MAKIFISYRHEDNSFAGRLYDWLVDEFGESNIFIDFASLSGGVQFAQFILGALREGGVCLAMIGKKWVRPPDPTTTDWVKKEITEAFGSGMKVFPVLIDGAVLPQDGDWPDAPDTLRRLIAAQALRLRADPDFRNDAQTLITTLRSEFSVPQKPFQDVWKLKPTVSDVRLVAASFGGEARKRDDVAPTTVKPPSTGLGEVYAISDIIQSLSFAYPNKKIQPFLSKPTGSLEGTAGKELILLGGPKGNKTTAELRKTRPLPLTFDLEASTVSKPIVVRKIENGVAIPTTERFYDDRDATHTKRHDYGIITRLAEWPGGTNDQKDIPVFLFEGIGSWGVAGCAMMVSSRLSSTLNHSLYLSGIDELARQINALQRDEWQALIKVDVLSGNDYLYKDNSGEERVVADITLDNPTIVQIFSL